MSKFCNNCGNMVEDSAVFCTNCGATFQEEAAYAPAEAPVEAPVAPAKKPVNKKLIGIIAGVAAVAVVAVVALLLLGGKKEPWDELAEMQNKVSQYRYTEEGWEYTYSIEDKESIKDEVMEEIIEVLEDKYDIEADRVGDAYRVWMHSAGKCDDDIEHSISETCFIQIDGNWYMFDYYESTDENGKEILVVDL